MSLLSKTLIVILVLASIILTNIAGYAVSFAFGVVALLFSYFMVYIKKEEGLAYIPFVAVCCLNLVLIGAIWFINFVLSG